MKKRPFKKWSSQKGQATVEFAITSVFFFAIVLAIFDIMHVCYCWAAAQYAVNEAARDGMLQGDNDKLQATFDDIADALRIPERTLTLRKLGGDTTPLPKPIPPLLFYELEATSTVRLTILGMMHTVIGLPSDSMTVTARSIVRNEPYD